MEEGDRNVDAEEVMVVIGGSGRRAYSRTVARSRTMPRRSSVRAARPGGICSARTAASSTIGAPCRVPG